MAAAASPRPRPDGIEPRHVEPPRGGRTRANPLPLAVLGAIVAAGAVGLAGSPSVERTAEGADARLTVSAPEVIRNGEVYESRILVEARRPIGKLVIGVAPELWRDTTVNSMVPAPSDETHADGLFRFAYGALDAGDRFEVKISLQINPSLSGRNAGRVVLLDGPRPLLDLPRTVRVLP